MYVHECEPTMYLCTVKCALNNVIAFGFVSLAVVSITANTPGVHCSINGEWCGGAVGDRTAAGVEQTHA